MKIKIKSQHFTCIYKGDGVFKNVFYCISGITIKGIFFSFYLHSFGMNYSLLYIFAIFLHLSLSTPIKIYKTLPPPSLQCC